MATAIITPDQDTIVAEIFIAALPERVFQAITTGKVVPNDEPDRGPVLTTEVRFVRVPDSVVIPSRLQPPAAARTCRGTSFF